MKARIEAARKEKRLVAKKFIFQLAVGNTAAIYLAVGI